MKPTLEIVTMLISVSMFLAGLVTWYSGAVRKRYAAQRDYEHLKTSYKQLASGQSVISKDMDSRFDSIMLELKEVKAMQLALMVKINPSETSSGFFRSQGDRG